MINNELTHKIIGAAIEVHEHLGLGLLESAYEACLARELEIQECNLNSKCHFLLVIKAGLSIAAIASISG